MQLAASGAADAGVAAETTTPSGRTRTVANEAASGRRPDAERGRRRCASAARASSVASASNQVLRPSAALCARNEPCSCSATNRRWCTTPPGTESTPNTPPPARAPASARRRGSPVVRDVTRVQVQTASSPIGRARAASRPQCSSGGRGCTSPRWPCSSCSTPMTAAVRATVRASRASRAANGFGQCEGMAMTGSRSQRRSTTTGVARACETDLGERWRPPPPRGRAQTRVV